MSADLRDRRPADARPGAHARGAHARGANDARPGANARGAKRAVRMLEAQIVEVSGRAAPDADARPCAAAAPTPRRNCTLLPGTATHHTALVLVINAPTSARQAGSPLIHNPSDPFHAILPCHVMCSFEPTSSGITASNLQTPPVYRSYAHDAFQAPAPRATHASDDGHMGSWVCETDKFKTWDDGYMGMMGPGM